MGKAKAVAPSKLETPALSDLGADVEVRRHPAARRLTLRVSQTRRAVIVTVPMQCDLVEAGSFLHRNIDWVRERLGSIPEPIAFEPGAVMPVRGEPHALHFTGLRTRGRRIESTPADTPHSYATLTVNGPTEHAAQRLTDWLFSEARRDLDARVVHHAGRLGLKAKRITVRDQVVMTGGVARNDGVAQMLEEKLGHPVLVLPEAQITGAIGAALIAQELDG